MSSNLLQKEIWIKREMKKGYIVFLISPLVRKIYVFGGEMKDISIDTLYGVIKLNSPKAEKLFDERDTIFNFYEEEEPVDVVWAKKYNPYYPEF